MPRFKDKDAIKAIRAARGLLSVAARSLSVSRQALYDRMKKSEPVRRAVEEEREWTGDVAEANLYQAIEAAQPWAIKYYLNCQAKSRGYVERTELAARVEHAGGIAVNLEESRQKMLERLDAIALRRGVQVGDGNGDGRP